VAETRRSLLAWSFHGCLGLPWMGNEPAGIGQQLLMLW